MNYNYSEDTLTAIEAKFEAQKIAFGPILFHAAKSMRDLGILDCIRKRAKDGITLDEISAATKISTYGVKVLVEIGLSGRLIIVKDDKYFLTKTGMFMDTDEMTRVNMNFTQDVCYKEMEYLTESIQTGKPAGLKVSGDWESVYQMLQNTPESDNSSWFEFDHYYSDHAFPLLLKTVFADDIQSLMDIGANTGKWSKLCLEHSDQVKVTAVDLPGQLERARANIEAAGNGDRFTTYPADLLSPETTLPSDVDVVWMSQFLDCFSEDEIVSILEKIKANMRDDTVIYINETFWDKQEYEAAAFSLHATSLYFTCIANGNSKMYHSADMIKCIDKAGLKVTNEINDIGLGHTLLKCELA